MGALGRRGGARPRAVRPRPSWRGQVSASIADPCRPGADPRKIDAWEQRHGFKLPAVPPRLADPVQRVLRRTARSSTRSRRSGPMVPFARMPELVVQPESWFELGNPNVETVCIDLALPLAGRRALPIFTSGDDQTGSRPRVIATSFEAWFIELLRAGGAGILVRLGIRRPRGARGRPTAIRPHAAAPARLRPLAAPGHSLAASRGRRPLGRDRRWGSRGSTSRRILPAPPARVQRPGRAMRRAGSWG